ncbi:MAG TPA: hypothetical protein VGH93_10585 [Solirubrobacteraceae bacterium]
MTNRKNKTPESSGELLRFANERAERLSASSREERQADHWHVEAAHVGDMSVLALALMRAA